MTSEQDSKSPRPLVSVTLTYQIDPPIKGPGWYQRPFFIKGLIASWNTSTKTVGVQVWGARQKKDGTLADENMHRHVWGEYEKDVLAAAGYVPEHLIEACEAAKWVVR